MSFTDGLYSLLPYATKFIRLFTNFFSSRSSDTVINYFLNYIINFVTGFETIVSTSGALSVFDLSSFHLFIDDIVGFVQSLQDLPVSLTLLYGALAISLLFTILYLAIDLIGKILDLIPFY